MWKKAIFPIFLIGIIISLWKMPQMFSLSNLNMTQAALNPTTSPTDWKLSTPSQTLELQLTLTNTPFPTSTPIPTSTNSPTQPPPTYTSSPTHTPTTTPSETPIPTLTASAPPRLPHVEVIREAVQIHSGAGENYPVIRFVNTGDILFVQAKNVAFDEDPWLLIRILSDGTEEWISGSSENTTLHNIEELAYRASTAELATPVPVCGSAPPPEITQGRLARVSSLQVKVHTEPGLRTSLVGPRFLRQDRIVDVIDGPKCVDGGFWWQIYSTELDFGGWVVEYYDGDYLLKPYEP